MSKTSETDSTFVFIVRNTKYSSTMSSSSQRRKRARTPSTSHPSRVVLLLDLDCFYAQCETVRLGLDTSLPLCLLQWNSALAVNYPAREFGIKRGDGFDEIKKKSSGECVALHLPVISVSDVNTSSNGSVPEGDHQQHEQNGSNADGSSELEQSYNAVYNLSQHVRDELFSKDKDVMRYPHQGKASLERYRLASARIFSVIALALERNVGKGNFVLERASIDEIFLDVTDHCYSVEAPIWKDDLTALTEMASNDTVVFGSLEETNRWHHIDDEDEAKKEGEEDAETIAIRRGCIIARGVRKAVYDALGFTMSAGISSNKTVSKLGASYGKPNGQAVVYRASIQKLMDDTPIRKVRNMGGKIGKQVKSLLPEDEDKMGSITRLISLPEMTQKLGRETAQRVYNVARGIDNEPVLETKGALTKSITAFKSFGASNLDGLQKWVKLLASDVLSRVEQDTVRNHRHPKSCNIQYIFSNGGSDSSDRTTRSARISFPKASLGPKRLEKLIAGVIDILEKRNNFPIHRLGLSAIDFAEQSQTGAIDSFFSKQAVSPKKKKAEEKSRGGDGFDESKDTRMAVVGTKKAIAKLGEQAETSSLASNATVAAKPSGVPANDNDADLEYARKLQASLDGSNNNDNGGGKDSERTGESDLDLEYARKLQATYDKEESLLSTLDSRRNESKATGKSGKKRSAKRKSASSSSSLGWSGKSKAGKIDNFFTKK